MRNNTKNTRNIGNIGEDIACRFLTKHGYRVLDRNYWAKWGEIDIVAKKSGKIYFVEVKSVSRKNPNSVIHETSSYRPEENIHRNKLKRLHRTLQTYLIAKDKEDVDWQIDALIVYMDFRNREASIEQIENII